MAQEPLTVTLNVDPNHYAKAKKVLGDEEALLSLLATVIERVATEEMNPLMPPKRVFEKPKVMSRVPQDSLFDEPEQSQKPLSVTLRPGIKIPNQAWPTLEKPEPHAVPVSTHRDAGWMHPLSSHMPTQTPTLAGLESANATSSPTLVESGVHEGTLAPGSAPIPEPTTQVESHPEPMGALPPLEPMPSLGVVERGEPPALHLPPMHVESTLKETPVPEPHTEPVALSPTDRWSYAKVKTQQAFAEAQSSLAWRDRERLTVMNTPAWTTKHPLYSAPQHPKPVLETKTFRMDKSLLIQHPFKDAIIAEMTRQLNYVVEREAAPGAIPMGPAGLYAIKLDYPGHPWMALWLETEHDVILIRGGHPEQLFEAGAAF